MIQAQMGLFKIMKLMKLCSIVDFSKNLDFELFFGRGMGARLQCEFRVYVYLSACLEIVLATTSSTSLSRGNKVGGLLRAASKGLRN